MSIITNWASFYRDLVLEADDGSGGLISPELHLPIMESDGVITSIWNDAILFASGKNRLGILLMTRDRLGAAPCSGSGPVGRVVI